MSEQKSTQISTLGEFGLIDHLTKDIKLTKSSTVKGVGDDCAVVDCGDYYMLLTSDLMLEGINFDLTYFPLKHLGYKAVVVACSDIYAMNGLPEQLTISIGVSSKFTLEHLEQLYEGVNLAAQELGVDVVGGDTSSSLTGLTIALSALGRVDKDKIVYRSGAQQNDLICVTGDLGAAYMGLHLLEREKIALKDIDNPQPMFEGHEYILEKQLKPFARYDMIAAMAHDKIVPTSMIDLSDGLSSDLINLCKSSKCGARVYLDRLPIAKPTYDMAEELNTDPVVAALNGGDDHELLFTVPLQMQEAVMKMGGVDVIGHITAQSSGVELVLPDGKNVPITAMGVSAQQ
ncbi:MAG: thiamine-phosphate kinase [Rikenellaceae bacterium]